MLADDFATARFNMIQQQVRPWEVLDERVKADFSALARLRDGDFNIMGDDNIG